MRVTYSISGAEISLAEIENISLINDGIAEICNAVRRRVRSANSDSAA